MSMEELFGEPIHVYTREQALEDGVLVDAKVGDFADVTAQHFGSDAGEVVMTAALFETIKRAVENERHCNDYKGVWHDVLFVGRPATVHAIKTFRATGSVAPCGFKVIITGTGRKKVHTVYVAFDGEALTYGFAEDF